MKKTYIAPQTETVRLKAVQPLLTASQVNNMLGTGDQLAPEFMLDDDIDCYLE